MEFWGEIWGFFLKKWEFLAELGKFRGGIFGGNFEDFGQFLGLNFGVKFADFGVFRHPARDALARFVLLVPDFLPHQGEEIGAKKANFGQIRGNWGILGERAEILGKNHESLGEKN